MSNEKTRNHGNRIQKPDDFQNQPTTTTRKNNNIEIITEESVIQYLNEILSVYLNESSAPTTPYDDESFFFEKEGVTPVRKDSKIFDIHYSNEGRQRRRQKSFKIESRKDDEIDSEEVKNDYISKNQFESRKNVKIDCVNDEKYHSKLSTNHKIDPTQTQLNTETNAARYTEEKIFRKVGSVSLDNSNTNLMDHRQTSLVKNNKNNFEHENDSPGILIHDKQQVTKRKIASSTPAPRINNNNNNIKDRARSMIIEQRVSSERNLLDKSNRQTRTRSLSNRETPNKEFTVSLYKTTTSTVGETGGTPGNTKLVCTMYVS